MFYSFTFSNKNVIERLLNSWHQLQRVFSKLEHSQVSERTECQGSLGFVFEREKSTQGVLNKKRIFWKDVGISKN